MLNLDLLFKRSLIAAATAVYVAVPVSAAPGMVKHEGTSFHLPTFTARDVESFNQERQQALEGNLYIGGPGLANRQAEKARFQQVFVRDENVSGVQKFIVQFTDAPVATYDGSLQGFVATKPSSANLVVNKTGVDIQSATVKQYQNFLLERQQDVITQAQSAGARLEVQKSYTLANNAMLVEMTQEDAEILANQTGVKRITPHRILKLQSDRGASFINADKLWTAAGIQKPMPVQGEGMVVGIIDTGINTDHIAFDGTGFTNPRGKFYGDCEDTPALCNNKLIGVRSYPEITDTFAAQEFQANPYGVPKYVRPANGEDYHGHGSHTASTAAGNKVENTPLQGFDGTKTSNGINLGFNFPSTSGVAPKAHIISYQVCWPGNGGDPYAGCPESAILSAFEDAIQDGVDTINFSIGGAESFPWEDPMELAFLAAREAGIAVAAAAGNSGPNYWSADHSSPWVTTVGASTHDRQLSAGDKTLANFEGTPANWLPKNPIKGKSFSGSITGQVVLAEKYPDPNTKDTYTAASCNVPFPAGTFKADQIVICERGDIARTVKADNVKAGGAGGIILQNIAYNADNLAADVFSVPGIQVPMASRYTLRNWVLNSNGTARATISDYSNSYTFDPKKGNNLAQFSSMGPSRTNNTLVPDLTAPGVDIYAANADDQPFTNSPAASDWTFMSGTSMAAPHVTGAQTLLKQLHPTWTPAEIQSALMMTAKPVWLNIQNQLVEPFYNFMAGAGAIDVASAANAGLIMDESIENYKNANPNNGGIANWLNLPSMVDMGCDGTCSWLRTVKATRDGTWKVEGKGKEEDVEITVSPSEFTLKAGESQTLIVKARLPKVIESKIEPEEPGAPWQLENNNYTPFNGTVTLTEVNGKSPQAHWPIVAFNVQDQLPVSYDMDISRDQGSETMIVNTDDYSQFTPRVYGPVKPTTYSAELGAVSAYINLDNIKKGWNIQALDVPADTKRFVVEVQDAKTQNTAEDKNPRYFKLRPYIIVGRDENGNGGFIPSEADMAADPYALANEYHREVLCVSTSESENNYCNLLEPKAGKYWVATVYIGSSSSLFKADVVTGYAMLGKNSDNGKLSLTGPSSHDGNGNYPIELNWKLSGSKQGERYYAAFDLGNKTGAEGTLGFTSLNITRGEDTLVWGIDKTKARSMDKVNVNVKIRPNLETDDRSYDLKMALPAGMRLVPSTLKTNNEAVAAALKTTEQGFTLSGVQPSTRHIPREYVMTTNATDNMCRTPQIDEHSDGKYINLHEFGIQPNMEWFVGGSNSYFDVPIDWMFWLEGADFKVYNQENAGFMRLHPVGAMQFNTAYWMMGYHRGPGFLYESLAPFWRGNFETKYRRNPDSPWGLTMATQYASDRPDLGDLLFMEFDNVTDKVTKEEFDFQAILRSGFDDHQGKYEIIYAYDNLGPNMAKGVVMVEGFDSVFSGNAGPKNGQLYSVLGFDNLDKHLANDRVVCFDYKGPEQSEIEVSFTAVVQPQATGKELDVKFDYALEGQPDAKVSHKIAVSGNIQLAPIADKTVAENGKLDNIEVMYVDANKVPNKVEVTGNNVTAVVSGDRFSLTPKADWFGETVVTVKVRDTEYADDVATTSFKLTVTSDGVEKGCMDSKASNFNPAANKDDGSCQYPAAVTNPPAAAKSSGGAFGGAALMLLALAGLRRRQR